MIKEDGEGNSIASITIYNEIVKNVIAQQITEIIPIRRRSIKL